MSGVDLENTDKSDISLKSVISDISRYFVISWVIPDMSVLPLDLAAGRVDLG